MSVADRAMVIEALQGMSDEDLRAVMRFVDSLRRPHGVSRPGSVPAVQRAIGSWWMTPQDTQQFLGEIDDMRHIDAVRWLIPSKNYTR